MIISASRRTDIPSFYSEWFFNRIREGFCYVRNPMNPQQVSRIDLSPKLVDCIVFWTKNPEPMLDRLDALAAYNYYFQFTLTGYGQDIECNVPHKKERMIPIFQRLSGMLGSNRVIWRYDPIIFNEKYTPEYHLKAFEQIAAQLNGCTKRCVISFVDTYAKNKKAMAQLTPYELSESELRAFAAKLSGIANQNGMSIAACAESMDLSDCGIGHSSCIDIKDVEAITGCKINAGKDSNQRKECGCIESVEIGTYNTCKNGCKYCYANYSYESVIKNCEAYDVNSPILCGQITADDRITERKMRSLRQEQLSLWD